MLLVWISVGRNIPCVCFMKSSLCFAFFIRAGMVCVKSF